MPEKKRRAPRRAAASPQGAGPDSTANHLREEIAMLRELIRGLHDVAAEGHDLEETLRILEVASISASRLAGLLKTQRQLDDSQDSGAVMSEAMAAKIQELTRNC